MGLFGKKNSDVIVTHNIGALGGFPLITVNETKGTLTCIESITRQHAMQLSTVTGFSIESKGFMKGFVLHILINGKPSFEAKGEHISQKNFDKFQRYFQGLSSRLLTTGPASSAPPRLLPV